MLQRLAGATLLVFANKQDLPGALSAEDIKEVRICDILKNNLYLTVACNNKHFHQLTQRLVINLL